MFHKIPIAMSALALALAASCCCCSLGGLLGETEFTTGDFADVPAYPGATQTTESDPAVNMMTRMFALFAQEVEWKQYTTTDSASVVLNWYEDTLPTYGWITASGEGFGGYQSQNAQFFAKEDDPQVMLVIFALSDSAGSGSAYVVIGRVRLSSSD